MTTTFKNNTQLVVPTSIQKRAGIKVGDQVEFKVSGSVITITAKLTKTEDDYTPAQRRVIDARLSKALAEVKKGHVSPAFETIEEFTAAIQADAAKLTGKIKTSPRR